MRSYLKKEKNIYIHFISFSFVKCIGQHSKVYLGLSQRVALVEVAYHNLFATLLYFCLLTWSTYCSQLSSSLGNERSFLLANTRRSLPVFPLIPFDT